MERQLEKVHKQVKYGVSLGEIVSGGCYLPLTHNSVSCWASLRAYRSRPLTGDCVLLTDSLSLIDVQPSFLAWRCSLSRAHRARCPGELGCLCVMFSRGQVMLGEIGTSEADGTLWRRRGWQQSIACKLQSGSKRAVWRGWQWMGEATQAIQ